MLDASTGYESWTRNWTITEHEALKVQEEIASSIARNFRLDLSGLRRALVRPHSRNPKAYNYYLKAAYYWSNLADDESLARWTPGLLLRETRVPQ